MESIAEQLLERSRKEKEADITGDSGRSIIGALLKAENAEPDLRLSEDEVLAQMQVLILAGYETTSISLTWALIELALRPDVQDKLRAELCEFATGDPSYDQFSNGLPYLDAVMREILRLHPALAQTGRVAAYGDVIPLNEPVTTRAGERVDRITVGHNAAVVVPIRAVNRAESVWGPDAKVFKPERWLNDESGVPAKARELQGYHHLLTFIDGPRTCLGRAFAIAEFKSVLSVLIRNYVFDMRDGPETKIDVITTILPRPKVVGEQGYAMPMRKALRRSRKPKPGKKLRERELGGAVEADGTVDVCVARVWHWVKAGGAAEVARAAVRIDTSSRGEGVGNESEHLHGPSKACVYEEKMVGLEGLVDYEDEDGELINSL
ncbi:hypothetical protein EW145_g7233 [Phellinidium pouzarii]|uniref:Cytochrome P450 n=1 Tax=Phellinidium pouzarii TaxID=167371 RepID=A0A4S4KM94_9AGAM|nr:hypothetical protein EW145_g7233 [Phellinidium pouzarii]